MQGLRFGAEGGSASWAGGRKTGFNFCNAQGHCQSEVFAVILENIKLLTNVVNDRPRAKGPALSYTCIVLVARDPSSTQQLYVLYVL